MNSNEIGTIITSLRESEKNLWLILGHLEEMRHQGADYEAVSLAYNIIHDAFEATGNALAFMQGVQKAKRR